MAWSAYEVDDLVEMARALLGCSVWTITLAHVLRRVRLRSPLRASMLAGVLVYATARFLWSIGEYDDARALYVEDLAPTPVAVGVLVSFLFYEWRDRRSNSTDRR